MYGITVPDAMLPDARHALVCAGFSFTAIPCADTQTPRYVLGREADAVRQAPQVADDVLTYREIQVLTGAANGLSNCAIGTALELSEDTVKTHFRRMFRKIGSRDRAHAVSIGYRRGWLGGAS